MIALLEDHGPWLLVHGHKHHARISFAGGSSSPPIVFSAASLGAYVNVNEPGLKNQFYILELEDLAGRLTGTVSAWDWNVGLGWRQAIPRDGGVFCHAGLGLPTNVDLVVAELARVAATGVSRWEEFVTAIPSVRYASPRDLAIIEKRLLYRHKLVVEVSSDGYWEELIRGNL